VCVTPAYASASGSDSYIQNGTAAQTANFNVTGSGAVGGNLRVLGSVTASTVTLQSTAAVKKDIVPVSAADAVALRLQLDQLPLFTFRYRDEGADAQPHTGVIAELAPAMILAPDGKAVDLYNYVGVTVGATKALSANVDELQTTNVAQQVRIDALERDVSGLRERNTALETRLTALESRVGSGQVQEASMVGDGTVSSLLVLGALVTAAWSWRNRARRVD